MSRLIEDNLVGDLKTIIGEELGSVEDYQALMQSLVIYIVNRDGKVLGHGIKIGKEMNNVK